MLRECRPGFGGHFLANKRGASALNKQGKVLAALGRGQGRSSCIITRRYHSSVRQSDESATELLSEWCVDDGEAPTVLGRQHFIHRNLERWVTCCDRHELLTSRWYQTALASQTQHGGVRFCSLWWPALPSVVHGGLLSFLWRQIQIALSEL